jgi:hypothetical protein
MSKKILVVACLVMMTTVFSGCDLLGGDKSKETIKDSKTESHMEQNKENGGDDEESFFGSMQDLIARGQSVKCAYNITEEEGEAKGVLYITGDKVRSEMEITEKETGKKMKVNSIIAEDWMYTWNNFMPGGTKMNMKEMQGEADEDYSQREADKMKEEMDYKCRPWITDNSKFAVPTDIEFKDMTKMMQGFQEGAEDFNMDEMEKSAENAKAKLCGICRADAECE